MVPKVRGKVYCTLKTVLSTYKIAEIEVGCVPPACCPYLPPCTVPCYYLLWSSEGGALLWFRGVSASGARRGLVPAFQPFGRPPIKEKKVLDTQVTHKILPNAKTYRLRAVKIIINIKYTSRLKSGIE